MLQYTSTIHVRLDKAEKENLERLTQSTGKSISNLIREAIGLLSQKKTNQQKTGKDFIQFAGLFGSGQDDLSTNKKHLAGYGR